MIDVERKGEAITVIDVGGREKEDLHAQGNPLIKVKM